MPLKKRRGPPGGSGPSSEIIAAVNSDGSDHSLSIPISQLVPRPVRPDGAMKTPVPRRAGTGASQDGIRSRNRSPTVTPLALANQVCRPCRGAPSRRRA